MPPSGESRLHDFPDRLISRLQAVPAHLRELVQAVLPEFADRLVFEKAQPLQNKMPLPDWRRLESDLLFEVPIANPGDVDAALICLLIESQMKADPAMPLRTLLYAVFYWERQWPAWETKHARKQPLRLNPVLPIILHTGPRLWKTHRSLADLFAGPEALKAYQPIWVPLLWDLAAHDADELLKLPGHWLPILAAIRVEHGTRKEYEEIFGKLLSRLEPLSSYHGACGAGREKSTKASTRKGWRFTRTFT